MFYKSQLHSGQLGPAGSGSTITGLELLTEACQLENVQQGRCTPFASHLKLRDGSSCLSAVVKHVLEQRTPEFQELKLSIRIHPSRKVRTFRTCMRLLVVRLSSRFSRISAVKVHPDWATGFKLSCGSSDQLTAAAAHHPDPAGRPRSNVALRPTAIGCCNIHIYMIVIYHTCICI